MSDKPTSTPPCFPPPPSSKPHTSTDKPTPSLRASPASQTPPQLLHHLAPHTPDISPPSVPPFSSHFSHSRLHRHSPPPPLHPPSSHAPYTPPAASLTQTTGANTTTANNTTRNTAHSPPNAGHRAARAAAARGHTRRIPAPRTPSTRAWALCRLRSAAARLRLAAQWRAQGAFAAA
jgi:hypothetical protein